jgi:hypothetical protein
VDEVEGRAQTEISPLAAHQAHTLTTLPAEGDGRDGTTALDGERV